MFEKVNPCHPDKVADRIAGAIVDLCYTKSKNPKVAVEVLLGHGEATIITESSEEFAWAEIDSIVQRITGGGVRLYLNSVKQDPHLAHNQEGGVRCGDNGIFKGVPPTHEQKLLTAIAASIYERWPYDGKYIIGQAYDKWPNLDGGIDIMEPILGGHDLTICQSHADKEEIQKLLCNFFCANHGRTLEPIAYDRAQIDDDLYFFPDDKINPLGEWTGGPDTDSGATNRKLGSDMGDGVTGGGLHGKDLTKADVSVNIVCYLKAVQSGQVVTAICSIGDECVTFTYADGKRDTEPFADIVEQARQYIMRDCGGFERFSEWGLLRP